MLSKNAASWVAIAAAALGMIAYTVANPHLGRDTSAPHRPLPPTGATSAPVGQGAGDRGSGLVPGFSFRVDADTGNRQTTYHFSVSNYGSGPVTLTRLGRSGPGLQLISAQATPTTIAPNAKAAIAATYQVTDCAKVTRGAWPFPVSIVSGGHERTQYLEPMGTGSGDQWQTALSDAVCNPQKAHL